MAETPQNQSDAGSGPFYGEANAHMLGDLFPSTHGWHWWCVCGTTGHELTEDSARRRHAEHEEARRG